MNLDLKILIVDDEVVIRELLGLKLNKLGYQILLAANSKQAIQMYHQYRDEIGLILVDNNMPKEGDGLNLTKNIRKLEKEILNNKKIPIISISGEYGISEKFEQMAKEAGITEFYPKPFKLDKLGDLITKYQTAA